MVSWPVCPDERDRGRSEKGPIGNRKQPAISLFHVMISLQSSWHLKSTCCSIALYKVDCFGDCCAGMNSIEKKLHISQFRSILSRKYKRGRHPRNRCCTQCHGPWSMDLAVQMEAIAAQVVWPCRTIGFNCTHAATIFSLSMQVCDLQVVSQ
jgi:hypothetical protein